MAKVSDLTIEQLYEYQEHYSKKLEKDPTNKRYLKTLEKVNREINSRNTIVHHAKSKSYFESIELDEFKYNRNKSTTYTLANLTESVNYTTVSKVLHLVPAKTRDRLVARLIDFLIVICMMFLISHFFNLEIYFSMEQFGAKGLKINIIVLGIYWLYHTMTLKYFNASLGKYIKKIKVITDSRNRSQIPFHLCIFRPILILTFILLTGPLFYMSTYMNFERRHLVDLILGTRVLDTLNFKEIAEINKKIAALLVLISIPYIYFIAIYLYENIFEKLIN